VVNKYVLPEPESVLSSDPFERKSSIYPILEQPGGPTTRISVDR